LDLLAFVGFDWGVLAVSCTGVEFGVELGFENERNPSFEPARLAGVEVTRASLADMAGA
jgi:hypothetical protein